MLTPRRIAQLGLGVACLTLVTSITVLVAGASDWTRPNDAQPSVQVGSGVTPLAAGQLHMQADLSQRLASDKQ